MFVDGAAGTTGLEIRERLAGRRDLEVVQLSEAERKDTAARRRALNDAGVVILCLPDDAAREAVSLIENPEVRVIDASTAHRVAPGWVFGFPELEPDGYEKLKAAKRVTNPGCWSTGFLGLVRPLLRAGLIPADAALSAHGVSGYSGGGKSMIEEFEKKGSPAYVETVSRTYAMQLGHKHVPEMMQRAGLEHPPIFMPAVGRYYRGMIVELPLHLWQLPGTNAARIREAWSAAYQGRPFIEIASAAETDAVKALDAEALKNTNKLKLYVFENARTQQARLTAVFDNLGKGASGAAVQSLNILLGLPETTGLQ
ncbi:MAG: N-acetyl-gamma-glutamyl-phosphate reductase [Alphaproteobacteria bacterium]|nr:N-acetyl-gamma-glutamyl-phosphate reductase [Alphaproteobacteria bacterium]